MSVLEIVKYPSPALRGETQPVEAFDDDLKKLVANMFETMYFSNGVGLAAPQVGVLRKLIVIDWNGHRYVLINPEILDQEGEERREEGCLSFPGIYEDVTRPERIRVAYVDENRTQHEEEIEGFLARVFSHEIDHLNATLLIDHLSPLKRTFLKKKLERKAKSAV